MRKILLLTALILILSGATAWAQDNCARCHENGQAHAAAPQTPPGVTVEAANCGECHQLQYNSYMTGEDQGQTPQKQERYPWQWGDTITYDSNAGELLYQNVIRNPNFNPPARGIEFPFVKVAEMPNYIESTEIWRETKTGGWDHPEAEIMLYKVQHPETELYWGSVHHNLGVTCADCHMPPMTAESGQTYTQHWLDSPLNNIEASCGRCHNQSAEELTGQVRAIQEQTSSLMQNVMGTMDAALDNLAAARDAQGVNETRLAGARESLEQALGFAETARDMAAEAADPATPPNGEVPPARRFPWVPVLLGLGVVVGVIAYFIRRR
jgi:formate-dependent nitrite reductase cytochrome c552 subunit